MLYFVVEVLLYFVDDSISFLNEHFLLHLYLLKHLGLIFKGLDELLQNPFVFYEVFFGLLEGPSYLDDGRGVDTPIDFGGGQMVFSTFGT